MTMHTLFCDTPLGRFRLEEKGGALTRAALLPPGTPEVGVSQPSPLLQEAERQLQAYLSGRLRDFDLPVSPQGTPFQREVWAALRTIGWGELRSYGEVAHAIGRPKASRAVGMACHHNPILIVVPCHRVIGAGGTLTGFACGLDVKRALLRLEGSLLL